MSKLVVNFLSLMFRYYRSRKSTTDSFAYFEAIISLILILYLNLLALAGFFDLLDFIPGFYSDIPRYMEYLVGSILTLLVAFVINKLFKKEDVLKMEMDKRSRRIGYGLIIFYFLISIIFLGYFAVTKITIYDLF